MSAVMGGQGGAGRAMEIGDSGVQVKKTLCPFHLPGSQLAPFLTSYGSVRLFDQGAAGQGHTLVDVPDEDQLLLEAQIEAGLPQATVRYEQRLIQLAAGAAAEELAYGQYSGAGAPEDEQGDWAVFFNFIGCWRKVVPPPTSPLTDSSAPFSAAIQEAKQILQSERYRPVLGPLINHLEAQRCLSEEDLAAFLVQHGLHSPAPDGPL